MKKRVDSNNFSSNKLFLFALALSVFVFISINSVNAQTSDPSCYIDLKSVCTDQNGDTVIMGLSDSSNAHGEKDPDGDYNYALCCNFGGGDDPGTSAREDLECTGGTTPSNNKILGLSSSTNAHAEKPSNTNYNTEVCYGGVSGCFATTANCASDEDEVLVTTLSSDTNAHISSDYSTKICCTVTQGPRNCNPTDAYWSLDKVNPISSGETALEGQKAYLIVEGVSCGSSTVSFNVFDEDALSADDPASTDPEDVQFNENGRAIGEWSAEYVPDGGSNPQYYFEATVLDFQETSINSDDEGNPLLEVEESSVDCSQITICDEYSESATCNADNCQVSPNSVPENVDCSDPDISCGCEWDGSQCDANWAQLQTNEDGTVEEIGSCKVTENTEDDCSDGFLSYSWTASWTGSGAAPDSCQDGSQTIECPAQIQLPFFGAYNFIIALVIVMAIYAIAALSDRKNRKKLMKVFE